MRMFTLIATMSLLLMGCTAAEEYINVEDSETGITSPVLKTVWDWFNKCGQLSSCETAIMCYDKVIDLDPSYAPPWVNKGFCLKSLGKYDEALNAFDEATKLNPLMSGVWYEKGNILLEKGDNEGAMKAYNISIEIDPDYANSWESKGKILGRNGMYQDAIKCFDEAIICYDADHMKKTSHMSDPKDAKFPWYYKSVAFYEWGKYDEAIKACDEAIRLDPNLEVAWYYKGLALQKLGRTTEANAVIAKAKELGYTG